MYLKKQNDLQFGMERVAFKASKAATGNNLGFEAH
jgi:hypothetical protein